MKQWSARYVKVGRTKPSNRTVIEIEKGSRQRNFSRVFHYTSWFQDRPSFVKSLARRSSNGGLEPLGITNFERFAVELKSVVSTTIEFQIFANLLLSLCFRTFFSSLIISSSITHGLKKWCLRENLISFKHQNEVFQYEIIQISLLLKNCANILFQIVQAI